LIETVGARYRIAAKIEKTAILDEFTAVTGYHRKHAIRVLDVDGGCQKQLRPRNRLYDEACARLSSCYGRR
jgi:hypothetical protein